MTRIALALILCCLGLTARAQTFAPSDEAFPNPLRGWWVYVADSILTATPGDYGYATDSGATLVYGLVRLDDYRDRDLTDAMLADLDRAFATARGAGVKLILRFAYNYPGNSWDYENAQDAPLDQVLRHIQQLTPLIVANQDTIAVWQAGFIGAWGEAHTSSNGLDSETGKLAIRDALLAAAPPGMDLQWRYPPDLIGWGDLAGPMGFHNDCFLSSPTDVGSYAEDPALQASQRAAMQALTAATFHSGETCDADADMIRAGCADILREGPLYHVSALGLDYYTAFHDQWRAEGCLAQISARMGYRLWVQDAALQDGGLTVTLRNDGWAALVDDRPAVLTAYAGGQPVLRMVSDQLLSGVAPGQGASLAFADPALAQADRLCLAAPDPSPRLADDPRAAIRFANADNADGAWDPGLAAFCWQPG
jgi:hypothetical protein